MEFHFKGGKISLQKELNSLDSFVFDFCSLLDKENIKYVIVSGYVAILFGRSRSSEDIDLIVERISKERFRKLWEVLVKNFECLNTTNAVEAYAEYLLNGVAVRFARMGEFIPNMEFKFPKGELDQWTLQNRQYVEVLERTLPISRMELQITFKLFLGSEKDIEDARFLYRLFRENLDSELFEGFLHKLKIGEKAGYLS
ncbi:MAG TPA: hypothetical protein VJK52_06155 [Candidatus Nanoarchaeia archaeon]|nr:hypothetical protein [Candidatus Nanoarchaeia archaeon]